MPSLRENIGKRILKRRKAGLEREVRVQNFDTASRAVLLFDTGDTDSFHVIKDFVKFLKEHKISCRVFVYVPQKEVPQELLFWKDYAFITRKDLNWHMKPVGEVAESLYTEEVDIFLDFTIGTPLEIQYLVQLSPASFKVGCYTEGPNDYDLMINLNEPCDVSFLSEQFKRYISMLNPV